MWYFKIKHHSHRLRKENCTMTTGDFGTIWNDHLLSKTVYHYKNCISLSLLRRPRIIELYYMHVCLFINFPLMWQAKRFYDLSLLMSSGTSVWLSISRGFLQISFHFTVNKFQNFTFVLLKLCYILPLPVPRALKHLEIKIEDQEGTLVTENSLWIFSIEYCKHFWILKLHSEKVIKFNSISVLVLASISY